MKYLLFSIIILAILFNACNTSPSANQENKVLLNNENSDSISGEILFEKKCMLCHIKTKTSPHMKYLSSPPMTGVAYHMKLIYTDSVSGIINRQAAYEHIMTYVLNPDVSISICDSARIGEYGMMPSLKGSVSEYELEAIANYILDNFLMKEYQEEAIKP